MLTIKRKISAQQPSVEFIAKIIQRGKDTGLSSERIAHSMFLEFNKPPSYETVPLQIGQQVKIVGELEYGSPKQGTICNVVRIEIKYKEDDSDYIEVQLKAQGVDDYNEFQVSANPQDVSEFIELI